MPIHWKAVEQYFTVVLFVNPLTPRVKPWVTQSFLTFEQNSKVCLFIGKLLSSTLQCCSLFFTQVLILENLSVLDLALSGVQGLI